MQKINFGLFSSSPFFFLKVIIWKLFKMTFHLRNCSKRCQREQVNTFLEQFKHANCRVNSFWTSLFCNLTKGVGNWKRAQLCCQKKTKTLVVIKTNASKNHRGLSGSQSFLSCSIWPWNRGEIGYLQKEINLLIKLTCFVGEKKFLFCVRNSLYT